MRNKVMGTRDEIVESYSNEGKSADDHRSLYLVSHASVSAHEQHFERLLKWLSEMRWEESGGD